MSARTEPVADEPDFPPAAGISEAWQILARWLLRAHAATTTTSNVANSRELGDKAKVDST